ncbi:RNA polymerase sigma factor [Pedobacter hartonius]|uniref:RNA polymerase sigma-70 factor, ECF subfamily n=1 Tax=Pedobacter hartonius TaxID=425514 RepID=A0A1H4BRG4_9SPHI|nr:sigma-70 family RNA polymerase sigma factor [Pedobacter hartonius]SEA50693.1 RNA polymerase sigma-70 factor, ECF subfamily [Pedobacter hartonius]
MNFSIRKHPSDEQLTAGIQLGNSQRQLWESKLYLKYKSMISTASWKHNLTEDDTSMAYSDAVMTTISTIISGRFEQRSSLKTYISRILEYKCIDRIRTNSAAKSAPAYRDALEKYLEILPGHNRDIVQQLSEKYEVTTLKKYIQSMDEKCKGIIIAWGEGYHDQEIADHMGYLSAAVAKTSRLRCLGKLKTMYTSVTLKGAYNHG